MASLFGYCRVSTDRQGDEGQSLDVQQHMLIGYAMQHGLGTPVMFIERGVSGSIPLADRPEGKRLMAQLQPGDHIATVKLDRIFRSAVDALNSLDNFKAKGVRLHLLDLGGDVMGNGMSKLLFTIVAAFAEAERDRIRERILDVKSDQRGRGHYLGGKIPFGYRVVGHRPDQYLVPVPAEQAALQLARRMRDDGHRLHAIRDALTEAGHMLSISGLHTMLRRHASPPSSSSSPT